MLTVFDDEEYRKTAKANGVDGYVIKKALLDDLAPAIKNFFVRTHI